ncbi:MAG: helix-turn-helix domain-containing protein, partial [Oscillospiraceae bacterium]
MRDLNKAFGAAVSEARRKLGLTQVGLAEELGTTDQFISDMENG